MEKLNNFEQIKQSFDSRVYTRKYNNFKVIKKIGAILSVTFVTLFLMQFFGIGVMKVSIQIIFLVGFVVLTILYLALEFSKDSKSFYQYLLPEIISGYEHMHGNELKYSTTIKQDKEINKAGGIFTRGAANNVKFRLSGYVDGVPYTMDQSYIFVSTGKTTTVYLNGMYLFFGIREPNLIQVRDKWRPSLKGVKFLKDKQNKKIFTTETSSVDQKYVALFHYLKKNAPESVYLSANESGLHIALNMFKFEKPYILEEKDFISLHNKLEKLMDIKDYVKTNIIDTSK